MANRPFLMSHDSPSPLVAGDLEDNETIVAAASNQIPLLWLSLFSSGDFKTVDMALEDAAGNASVGPVPTLHSSLESANQLYRKRRPGLIARLDASLQPHLQEWEALLASLRRPFVQIDLAEIWMMSSDEEFRESISAYLAGVEGSSESGWQELCAQATLGDGDVARFGLRGYEWNAPVPWTD